jgi:PHP family Zn ribbon phosphoesterase
MSSDPEMNWHIKELNDKTIVSFSDSHSFWPWRLGREATIFAKADAYKDIIDAIRENKILGTVETDLLTANITGTGTGHAISLLLRRKPKK